MKCDKCQSTNVITDQVTNAWFCEDCGAGGPIY